MTGTSRRRLFDLANLVFIACTLVGLVLIFGISGTAGKVIVAVCVAVLMLVNLVLRLTVFRTVLPELRAERARRHAGAGGGVTEP